MKDYFGFCLKENGNNWRIRFHLGNKPCKKLCERCRNLHRDGSGDGWKQQWLSFSHFCAPLAVKVTVLCSLGLLLVAASWVSWTHDLLMMCCMLSVAKLCILVKSQPHSQSTILFAMLCSSFCLYSFLYLIGQVSHCQMVTGRETKKSVAIGDKVYL